MTWLETFPGACWILGKKILLWDFSKITSSSNKHFTFNHYSFLLHSTLWFRGPSLKLFSPFFWESRGIRSHVASMLTPKLRFQPRLSARKEKTRKKNSQRRIGRMSLMKQLTFVRTWPEYESESTLLCIFYSQMKVVFFSSPVNSMLSLKPLSCQRRRYYCPIEHSMPSPHWKIIYLHAHPLKQYKKSLSCHSIQ